MTSYKLVSWLGTEHVCLQSCWYRWMFIACCGYRRWQVCFFVPESDSLLRFILSVRMVGHLNYWHIFSAAANTRFILWSASCFHLRLFSSAAVTWFILLSASFFHLRLFAFLPCISANSWKWLNDEVCYLSTCVLSIWFNDADSCFIGENTSVFYFVFLDLWLEDDISYYGLSFLLFGFLFIRCFVEV